MSLTADFPFDIEDVTHLLGLTIRRNCGDGVYTDCPLCGDKRGKLKVNYIKNVWRCNYCQESGGMLQLYASVKGVSTQVAYRDICEALQNGIVLSRQTLPSKEHKVRETIPESTRVASDVLHTTYSAMLCELELTKAHREHLREVRGLTDMEIDRLGFKSTPPFYRCHAIAMRLMELGYTLCGVPGFYEKDGKWTVNFNSYTAGILLPARDYDGHIIGFQVRLDVPIKDANDKSDKPGTKYVWFSSSGKTSGCSSGSPVHLIGDKNASTVYVTEGVLKADIAHCIIGRTFAAIAGANNLSSLEGMFRTLSAGGTKLIIEAHDMDKYRNEAVERGATAISQLAHKYGMECKRLTWNPNYKGIDDWQLALHRKKKRKDDTHMNFKERFLHGLCDIDDIDDDISEWHESSEHTMELSEYLGLTDDEYTLLSQGNQELNKRLSALQTKQCFRIYQLDFDDENNTKPYAFEGIDALHKAGFTQPPANDYRLIYDGTMLCGKDESAEERLTFIFRRYNDRLPSDFIGRSISPSDVVELYSDEERRYYYRDIRSFCEVRFSPMLAKPMKQG